MRDNLSVPVVMVKVNGFDVLSAITHATTTWPGAPIGLVLHETIWAAGSPCASRSAHTAPSTR
ncbi:MAG: Sigma-54 dependent DNA-binding transcriptional regulator [uncultured Paraburkholderia sp.]|nr:MAG: Sigma-54 dependent DNA-binding transcriptional regulator [uncultured Paraburkholderia sp.]CAH2929489.1 MAG: Sigma-54 dependent DNA-binding transcriptional regulator [uncultured Paraburkholderia sp.]